jgi:uncharacterized protein (PEP-CTERM system associated)
MRLLLPRPLLGAALVAALPLPLCAQAWTVRPSLQAGLSATDNANHAAGSQARADLVASAQPGVAVDGQSPLLRLHAMLGAELVAHADGAQPDRAYPLLLADQAATLAPRWLFLDASASVRPTERDPYGARSEPGSSDDRAVTSAWRVSPYIEHELSPRAHVLARYEEMGSRSSAELAARQRFSNVELRLSHKPMPVGGSLGYESHSARFSGQGDSRSKFEALTVRGDLALASVLVAGPLVGRERSTLLLEESSSTLYGAHVAWAPDERTRMAAQAEHRFFGTGWRLEATHRMPWASFALQWLRRPVTAATSLGVVAAGTRLDSFLDAMLTTRVPDAALRKALVESLVASRGLRNELQRPVDVQAETAQREDSLRGTWVLMGARNIVALTAYRQSMRQLTRSGSVAAAVPRSLDHRQSGASLTFNRRLSPRLTLDASARWSRFSGLGAAATGSSREQAWRACILRALAPSTGLSVGVQFERLDTTRAGVDAYRARSAFAALRHAF